MVNTWDITIPELTGDETRRAYIYLPESYNYEPDRHYPVLYMFDGHNVFFDSHATYGKCWGMKEYMDYTNTQMIIVAVECNHSPDNGRLQEYSPFTFKDPRLGTITGRGKETMEWLIHTFKADIDSRFRTLPDREHTYIAGSSMGGLMSLYAVLEYNSVFSRAAALSPSVWISTAKIIALIKNSSLDPNTVVYMDYGSREINFHPNMRQKFGRVASQLLANGVMLDCRIVPGGNHCEATWEKQIPFFMNTLLYEP
ncbi:MAG: alpha/beta hydrolase-fold protein [Lachnospiraceae bacterium]|nr:alpha/beta hydrolase-fold protein [Robinsoniella sp.]MDY3765459.1 alpha/beta hydrolase-fold protein [Lachnospiraceae bacterium]